MGSGIGTPVYGCDGCRTTIGALGCSIHGPAGVATAEAVAHRHVWVYDGQAADASLIYHCDSHDPPLVRLTRAAVLEALSSPDQPEPGS